MGRFYSNKLVVFGALGRFSLLFARILKCFKFKVVYLQPAGSLNNEAAVDRLAAEGIEQVDYDRFRYYEVPWFYNKEIDLARKVYAALGHDETLIEFEKLYDGLNDWQPRLRAAAYDMIVKYFNETHHACIAADYFARHYGRVYLAVNTNAVLEMAFSGRGGYRNLFPGWLSSMLTLGKVMGLAAKFAAQQLKRRLSGKKLPSIAEQNEPPGNNADSPEEVLYFPHQGLTFGNLFTKDYYYSTDPDSPFHPSRILHLELHSHRAGDLPESATAYYQGHNLKYIIKPKYNPAFLARGAIDYLRFVGLKGVLGFLKPKTRVKHLVFGGVYALYSNYIKMTEDYARAKVALVGYDALFPKTMSMALAARGITVVAAQERFIMAFMPKFNFMLDQYFVWGKAVVDRLKKSDTSYVGTAIPIGPIRLDLIHQFQRQPLDDRIKEIKQNHHLIVVYEFPSGSDRMHRAMNPMVTWENNRAMYEDLIRLAQEIPRAYILLRGKDDVWCDLPEFKDIYDRIQAMPNMEINRDYSEFHISSRLASAADMVVAKHTSIAEEALAAGVPVLFYDFMLNLRRYVTSLYDFEGLPVSVLSYEDLKERIRRIIENGDYMDEEDFKFLRRYLYADAFDGNVHGRLQEALHGLLNKPEAESQTDFQARAAA